MRLFRAKEKKIVDTGERKRIKLLDTIRGLAILYMVYYHGLYDLVHMFGCEWAREPFLRQDSIDIYFTGAFIFLGGVTVRFSRNPAIRGARLFFVAAGFTLVTALVFPGAAVYFGILHLFSTGMLFYAVARNVIERIPIWAGAPLCALLFALTNHVQHGWIGIDGLFRIELPAALMMNNQLSGFGFINGGFMSVDYEPVFPWMFLFLLGIFLGRLLDRPLPKLFYRDLCPPITWIGKNSLIIYILHQPIMAAILWFIFK